MSKTSLVARFAETYSLEAGKVLPILASTAFKQRDGQAPSNEQMAALLIVADQYKLNPFTREIYAFPDKQNGIVPVVGVDGWLRIINSHPMFNGMDYRYSEKLIRPAGADSDCHEWVECVIHRKDREHPMVVREYLDEVYRAPFNGKSGPVKGPWQTHPKRFLRHKATIQAARVAFGFAGIYDQDEADRIVEQQVRDMGAADVVPAELPPVPADKLPGYIAAITGGQLTADALLAQLASKYTVSDEIRNQLLDAQIAGEEA